MVSTRPAPFSAQGPPCLFFPFSSLSLRCCVWNCELGTPGRKSHTEAAATAAACETLAGKRARGRSWKGRERKRGWGKAKSTENRSNKRNEPKKTDREGEREEAGVPGCAARFDGASVDEELLEGRVGRRRALAGSRRSTGELWSGTPDGDGGPGGELGGALGGGPGDGLGGGLDASFFAFSTVLLVRRRSWVTSIGADVCA